MLLVWLHQGRGIEKPFTSFMFPEAYVKKAHDKVKFTKTE